MKSENGLILDEQLRPGEHVGGGPDYLLTTFFKQDYKYVKCDYWSRRN
jgi:hypothetical protein